MINDKGKEVTDLKLGHEHAEISELLQESERRVRLFWSAYRKEHPERQETAKVSKVRQAKSH